MVVGQQFKNNLFHVSQNYLSQFLNLILIYLITTKLTIVELGLYGICRSILSFLEFSNLGTRFGLDFVLPYSKSKLSSYANTTLSLNFWISFLIVFVISFIYKDFDIIIFSIGGIFFLTFNLIRLINRALGNTSLFVKQSFFHNSIPLISQILGLLIYGFRGIVIGFLIGSLLNLILSKIKFYNSISYMPKTNLVFKLVDSGKGLFILSLLTLLVVSIDRLFINFFYGTEFNGFYTFLTLVLSSFAILPNSITELAINKIVKNVKNIKNSNSIVLLNSFLITCASLALYLILYFTLNFILSNFFPEYLVIEKEIKIGMIYIFPFGLLGIFQYNLIAKKKHKTVVLSNILGTLLYYLTLFGICSLISKENALLFLSYNKILYAFVMFFLLLFFYLSDLHKT